MIVEDDTSLSHLRNPADGPECRRLPRSIGTEKRDNLSRLHLEGNLFKGLNIAVENGDLLNTEQGASLLFLAPNSQQTNFSELPDRDVLPQIGFDYPGIFRHLFWGALGNELRVVDRCCIQADLVGTGEQGYTEDSKWWDIEDDWVAADEAKFNTPLGMAFDAAGNLYIADTLNHRIRKIDTGGHVWAVAGNGTAAWAGDGGPATEAELNYPHDVAVDLAGNLYIADTMNGVIRKVDTDGIITTIAGVGLNGYFGDGGPAADAGLDYPKAIELDAAGNLYIADTLANRIRVITASDGIIRTIAGSGLFGDVEEIGRASCRERV